MIFYQIKLEDNKIKVLDIIDRDERPKEGAGTMFVNLEEMNKFDQSLIVSDYANGVEKYL